MNSASRTRNSLINILFSCGNQIIIILLAFVNRAVFLQCLSVDYLGIQGLFSDILNMISLADLGLGTAMAYTMYKPLAENNHDELCKLVNLYKKIYKVIAIAVALIGISLIPLLPFIINLENNVDNITLYYCLYLLNTIASYLVVYKTVILNADQKSYIISKYNSIFNILKTIFMTFFLFYTKNYTVYLIIQIIFTYLQNFYLSHKTSKMYPYINKKVSVTITAEPEIFKTIKSAFLYKISGVLMNATDNTLISILVNTSMVGIYSNYSMVIVKISGIINVFFYAITSSLGNLIVKASKSKCFQIFKIMQLISSLISVICTSCLLFLMQDFIKLWLGHEYVIDNLSYIASMIIFYFGIILLPIWVFREATGLYSKTKYWMLLAAILNILLSVILGKSLGLSGIIFASALSRIFTYMWAEPIILFREYFDTSVLYYFRILIKNVFVNLSLCCIMYFLSEKIIVTSIVAFFIKGIIGFVISIVYSLIFYGKEIKNLFSYFLRGEH